MIEDPVAMSMSMSADSPVTSRYGISARAESPRSIGKSVTGFSPRPAGKDPEVEKARMRREFSELPGDFLDMLANPMSDQEDEMGRQFISLGESLNSYSQALFQFVDRVRELQNDRQKIKDQAKIAVEKAAAAERHVDEIKGRLTAYLDRKAGSTYYQAPVQKSDIPIFTPQISRDRVSHSQIMGTPGETLSDMTPQWMNRKIRAMSAIKEVEESSSNENSPQVEIRTVGFGGGGGGLSPEEPVFATRKTSSQREELIRESLDTPERQRFDVPKGVGKSLSASRSVDKAARPQESDVTFANDVTPNNRQLTNKFGGALSSSQYNDGAGRPLASLAASGIKNSVARPSAKFASSTNKNDQPTNNLSSKDNLGFNEIASATAVTEVFDGTMNALDRVVEATRYVTPQTGGGGRRISSLIPTAALSFAEVTERTIAHYTGALHNALNSLYRDIPVALGRAMGSARSSGTPLPEATIVQQMTDSKARAILDAIYPLVHAIAMSPNPTVKYQEVEAILEEAERQNTDARMRLKFSIGKQTVRGYNIDKNQINTAPFVEVALADTMMQGKKFSYEPEMYAESVTSTKKRRKNIRDVAFEGTPIVSYV
jgi:hypothetical protein